MSAETPVQNAITNLDRAAQLRSMRDLEQASARLTAARIAGDEKAEMAARQDVDRAYRAMESRCAW